jgi:nicotinic acid mononucleotide adenylyltransferase
VFGGTEWTKAAAGGTSNPPHAAHRSLAVRRVIEAPADRS